MYFLWLSFNSIFLIENSCIPNPCLNNGICQKIGSLGYECKCSDGCQGYTCSTCSSKLQKLSIINF